MDYDVVAEFYDFETEGLTKDISLYIEYAKKAGGSVLELGCGTGRIVMPIAEEGIEVWGLDISREMLKIAQKKADLFNEKGKKKIKLIHGNMRNFDLKRKFSLVFIAARDFQAMLTKEDQGLCLDCARNHLVEGGLLIVDLFAPKHDRLAAGKQSAYLGRMHHKEWDVFITRRAETEYDLANQTLKEDRFYEWTDNKGVFHRRVWSFELSYLFRYEAELLLEKHGFQVEDVFGDFDKSPYDYYSGEQIFVARRKDDTRQGC